MKKKFTSVHSSIIHISKRRSFLFFSPSSHETFLIHFRCILSQHDVFAINKFRPNSSLRRLTLDSFYINDLHHLFHFYPSLEYLTIDRLTVQFPGFLPPFTIPNQSLHTLKLNCIYIVRFDYIAYLLSYFPHLIRLTIIAIGLDFLNSERWISILTSLNQLRSLLLDIKAVSPIFNDELSLSFLTGFWRQWHVAVDYSQDNQKYHLYTVPYRRSSFISTIHCLSITEAPVHAFHSVTDLYLKTNTPMQVDRIFFICCCSLRGYFRFRMNECIRMYVLFKSIKTPLFQSIILCYSNN